MSSFTDRISTVRVLLVLNTIFIIIVAILLYNKNKESAKSQEDLMSKISKIEEVSISLKGDIADIRLQKKEVEQKVVQTKDKIVKNETKKLSINSQPLTSSEALRVITEYFQKRGIPTNNPK